MKGLLSYFEGLTDPRVERTRLHSLNDIIAITICAVLSGCNDWEEIELYGQSKEAWLRTFLLLPNGIPSHDTINRVFAALDSTQLQQCFMDWVQSIAAVSGGKVVSIDGKRICNGGTGGKKAIVHLVSAWSSANNMVLGQIKTEDKSNEITAIPDLLEMLLLEGSIVTIDAMGCQTKIAEKIVAGKADYVLAVKDNQQHLLDDLKEAFAQTPHPAMAHTLETGHGRIEKRVCKVITDIDWVCKAGEWKNLQSLVCIETKRTDKQSNTEQTEQRFYLSSLSAGPVRFNEIIRGHWGIENKLHWCLDVVFREDYSTKQAGNAAENFSLITKIALNLLKNENTKKRSMKNKRLLCGWDENYLANIVFHKI